MKSSLPAPSVRHYRHRQSFRSRKAQGHSDWLQEKVPVKGGGQMRDRKGRWCQGSSPVPGRSCSINIRMPFPGWEQGRKKKGVERGLDCCIVLVIYRHRSQQCHIHRSRGDQERAWCWPLLNCVLQKCPSFVLCPLLLFVEFPTHISACECSANSSRVQLGGRGCPQGYS